MKLNLATSPNSVFAIHFAHPNAFGTSQTRKTLDEIAGVGREKKLDRILKMCYHIFERG